MGRVKSITLADEDGVQVNHLLSTNGLLPLQSMVADLSYKARINGRTFFAKENRRVKKRNSYTISFSAPSSTAPRYGFIQKFLTIDGGQIIALIKELIIVNTGPPNGVPDTIATAASQRMLFEVEGTQMYIFAHQIRSLCCNLSNSGWKLLTAIVNNVEIE